MNKQQSILFFDIDGTLLTPPPFTIPDSARLALEKAQAQGHLTFINSGRTFAMIPSEIKALGFDGYVCGCGTQIYMHDELLHSCSIPHSLCTKIVEMLRKCKIAAFFERSDGILNDGMSIQHPVITSLRKIVSVRDLSLFSGELAQTYQFDKFLAALFPDSDRETFRSFCEENGLVMFDHGNDYYEVTQAAYSKATGIQFLLERLQLPLENSYAFGDSNNDLPMLQYAANSIAMGNAMPEILPYCTYQTTDIFDNGIYNALEHFQLMG